MTQLNYPFLFLMWGEKRDIPGIKEAKVGRFNIRLPTDSRDMDYLNYINEHQLVLIDRSSN